MGWCNAHCPTHNYSPSPHICLTDNSCQPYTINKIRSHPQHETCTVVSGSCSGWKGLQLLKSTYFVHTGHLALAALCPEFCVNTRGMWSEVGARLLIDNTTSLLVPQHKVFSLKRWEVFVASADPVHTKQPKQLTNDNSTWHAIIQPST